MLESVTFKINNDSDLEKIQDFIAENQEIKVKKNRLKKQWTIQEILHLAVQRAEREERTSESKVILASDNPEMGRSVCVVERNGGYKMGVAQCKNGELFRREFGASLAFFRAMGWDDLADLSISTLL